MTPYPLIYTPPGMEKPACCPHLGPVELLPGKGPGADPECLNGGFCWGGPYRADVGQWTQTKAGWWLGTDGHRPQDTIRLSPNPRIARWHTVAGAQEGHSWRIPVLLTATDPDNLGLGCVSALDRIWAGGEWTAPPDLLNLQESLLSIIHGVPLSLELEERNMEVTKLAIGLLAVGHWIDSDLLAATGWLSERVMLSIIPAACDQADMDGDHV